MKKIILNLAVGVIGTTLQAATVIWAANNDNGFSLQSGAELANTNLVRVGSFDFVGTASQIDSQIAAFADNPLGLDSHWTAYADGRVGQGSGTAASHFEFSSIANTLTLGLEGRQLFLWIFASTTNTDTSTSLSTATQQGVFWLDSTVVATLNASKWKFPPQSPPTSTTVDITDLTNVAGTTRVLEAQGGHIPIGSFPAGTSTEYGTPNFGLRQIVVPEPTSVALLGFATVGLLGRRRRK